MFSAEYTLSALLQGTPRIAWFYLNHWFLPFVEFPAEMWNTHRLMSKMAEKKPFAISVKRDSRALAEYEQEYRKIEREIRSIHGKQRVPSFGARALAFTLVRIACVAAAFSGSMQWTILLSLLQFVFLPYSLPVSIIYGVQSIITLHTGSLIVYTVVEYLLSLALPSSVIEMVSIPIDATFMTIFILIDQALCAACLLFELTSSGKPKKLPFDRLVKSILWGFINSKTYYLVLLPLCSNVRLNVVLLALDFCLGISDRATSYVACFMEAAFYQAHRIGHLEYVYADAHKFHHYVHDTSPFDAHILGSGAPEEWLILMMDLLVASAGLTPSCLTPGVLKLSWMNKSENHTRVEKDVKLHSDNFHADHHLIPTTNFGITYPYEMMMATCPGARAKQSEFRGFHVTRVDTDMDITLKFDPLHVD